MFLDSIGLLLITLPFILPMADKVGFNLVWFGIILIKLLEMGMMTPPVGMNVYVIKAALKNEVSLNDIFRGVGMFILTDVFVLAILIAFPTVTLLLPALMFQ